MLMGNSKETTENENKCEILILICHALLLLIQQSNFRPQNTIQIHHIPVVAPYI
jgi:hypothetical protein